MQVDKKCKENKPNMQSTKTENNKIKTKMLIVPINLICLILRKPSPRQRRQNLDVHIINNLASIRIASSNKVVFRRRRISNPQGLVLSIGEPNLIMISRLTIVVRNQTRTCIKSKIQ